MLKRNTIETVHAAQPEENGLVGRLSHLSSQVIGAFISARNSILMNSEFQRVAPSLPVGGAVTRRMTRSLFDHCAGFIYSQVLAACVELDLFVRIKDGAVPVPVLAKESGIPLEAFRRLCLAAASLGFFEMRPSDRVCLGVNGAALMGNPSVFAMISHHALLYKDLTNPVDFLRTKRGDTHLGRYWAYAGTNTGQTDETDNIASDAVDAYTQLMAATQAFIADEVLRVAPLSEVKSLLDLGGGAGVFAARTKAQFPHLDVTVLDLPPVVEVAQEKQAEASAGPFGSTDDVNFVGGDFIGGPIPQGSDAISLVRILHDHDDNAAHRILDNAYDALPDGGRLIVAEPMAGTTGAKPIGDAYFGMYLWAMGSGRPRQASELKSMLRAHGFKSVRENRTRQPLLVRVLTSVK
ncbi:MAG: methyltransferase [Pseudomonadota bacterium]